MGWSSALGGRGGQSKGDYFGGTPQDEQDYYWPYEIMANPATTSEPAPVPDPPITKDTPLPPERYPGDQLAIDLNTYGIPTSQPGGMDIAERLPLAQNPQMVAALSAVLQGQKDAMGIPRADQIPYDDWSQYDTGLNPRDNLLYYDEIAAQDSYIPDYFKEFMLGPLGDQKLKV